MTAIKDRAGSVGQYLTQMADAIEVKIAELEKKVTTLEGENKTLKTKVEALERKTQALK